MANTIPIFRIFDYIKTIEYYINWLGFKIDWEEKPEHAPIYMQVSLDNIVLHLSEHYGDSCPGSRVFIQNFEGLKTYHKELLGKNYKYMKPGLDKTPWDTHTYCMELIDPFGNRLTFTNKEES